MKIFITIVAILWWCLACVSFVRLMWMIFDDEFDKKDVVSSLYQFTLAGITVAAFVYLI